MLKSVIDVLRDRRLNTKTKRKVEPLLSAKKVVDQVEQPTVDVDQDMDDDDEYSFSF